jgi:hypothetical protein
VSFTITVTGKDRPDLFREMLSSLRANDLEGWRVEVAIDGDRVLEFSEIAKQELNGVDYELTGNRTVLGIRLNPFCLLTKVFSEGSMLNLYLEEDFIVSPDATRLALWYHQNHRPKWACLNMVSGPCGSTGFLSNSFYPDILFESHTFNSLGFVTRRDEWFSVFKPAWMGSDNPPVSWRTHWGWDWSIYGLLADSDLVAVQPAFARVTHTGVTGTFSTARYHEKAFGNMEINRAAGIEYRLLDVAELPHPLRSHINLHEESTTRLVDIEKRGMF